LERENYKVMTAENGYKALDICRSQDIDLVLLDIMMPGMDGYQVLEQLKADESLSHIPVIVISAIDEVESAVRCIEIGAEDYLSKPFNPVLLKARVHSCLEKKRLHDMENEYRHLLENRVQQQVKEISQAQLGTIFAMSKLAESRDTDTGDHLERMREYCKILSEELRKDSEYRTVINDHFISNIYAASPLHDIGKVSVPDYILKKSNSLSDEEWAIMRTHTTIGADMLRAVDRVHSGNSFIQTGIEIAESHHEKWNGKGYPKGLKGGEIPLVARILAVADVYDALSSKRCYKEAYPHDESKGFIMELKEEHFDPGVVEAFLSREEDFIKIQADFNNGGTKF
ncbi:MAG TPA: response regulator, partial [Spirochaetes bacterium]|nr:response regulator [Spirochaetota bacterium]